MSVVAPAVASPSPIRWKRIVLPPEHGAWGFLFEPMIAALFLAPSTSGLFVALAAFAAFLARNPMRIALADRRLGVRSQRTRAAERAAGALAAAAALLLAGALATGDSRLLIPLIIALPVALLQQRLEAMRRSRELAAELLGTLAIGALASIIILAGGGSGWLALALWVLLTGRAVPAVLYVRSRIALDKRNVAPGMAPIVAHILAILASLVLLATPAGMPVASIVLGLLLLRCVVGLSRLRRAAPAKRVGIAELGWGVLMVVALVVF